MRRIACFFDVLSHHSRMVDLLPCQRDPGEASRLQFVKARFHETNSRGRPAQFHEENCHLTEPPPGSFSKVGASEFLWLDFNDIAFLRTKSLQGGGGGGAGRPDRVAAAGQQAAVGLSKWNRFMSTEVTADN